MCGIGGLLDLRSPRATPTNVKRVKRMTEAQAHRGPDDAGIFVEHPVYLGHRRLSIIDVDGGRQPLCNEDGSIVVVFNGELYNFPELRAGLEARGHVFHSRSDTEVIVHLYEELGDDLVPELSGMFAFALWDQRARRLLLARDRMGQKPLYYSWDPGGDGVFAFASELRSLMESRETPWHVDVDSVSRFLLYDAVPAPNTILEGVKKLEPGHLLTINAGGDLETRCYWDVPFSPEHDLVDPKGALRAFDESFVPAVERHLLSDVPLGLFLSGGLDSTAVLYAMAQVKPVSEIRSFAVGFEERSFDESEYASAVAAQIGSDHSSESLSADVMIDLVPKIVEVMDEPIGDPSFVPTYLLSRFTRKSVTVALGGDGGDELFLGYPTFLAHGLATSARRFLPGQTPAVLRAIAERLVPVSSKNISPDYQLKRFLTGLSYGEWERHPVWFGAQPPREQAALFAPGRVNGARLPEMVLADVHRHVARFSGHHSSDMAAYLYMKLYLENLILNKVDRASMAVSLEVRAPFLDPEVVSVCTRIHPKLKLRGTTTKWLLRRYLDGRIDAGILARKKKGFGVPLSAWFRGPLAPWLSETLSPERLDAVGLFSPSAVAALLQEHALGRRDRRKVLWNLAVLHEWLRIHKERVVVR